VTEESSPAVFQRKSLEPTSACSTPVVLVVTMEEGRDADGKNDDEEEEEEEDESKSKETQMDTNAIDTASSADEGVPHASEAASMTHGERSFHLAKTVHNFVSTLVESGHGDAEVWDAFSVSFSHGPATFTRRKPCFTGSINRAAASEAILHHFQHKVEEDGSTQAVADASENGSLDVATESLDTVNIQEDHRPSTTVDTSDTTSFQLDALNVKLDTILAHLCKPPAPHADDLGRLEAPPPLSREVEVEVGV